MAQINLYLQIYLIIFIKIKIYFTRLLMKLILFIYLAMNRQISFKKACLQLIETHFIQYDFILSQKMWQKFWICDLGFNSSKLKIMVQGLSSQKPFETFLGEILHGGELQAITFQLMAPEVCSVRIKPLEWMNHRREVTDFT